uniref:Uncharacterized protein n=1 Tax=Candidatus Kentrum sp. FW TaxID=2126338 RepID=A0A450SGX9_9GAMM|nr:MAG: hypothetical protein BECKFW1821B_GA0114236_101212 [Candidatus Kentron sp. FW]
MKSRYFAETCLEGELFAEGERWNSAGRSFTAEAPWTREYADRENFRIYILDSTAQLKLQPNLSHYLGSAWDRRVVLGKKAFG